MRVGWVAVVAAAAVLATACAPGATGTKSGTSVSKAKPVPMAVLLGFKMIGMYSLASLAIADGDYARAGLDVTLQQGVGSSTTVQTVGSGTTPIALVDIPTAAVAIGKGEPETVVAGLFQKSPDAVISLASDHIRKPADLIGKTVAINPAGSIGALFPAFLKANGLRRGQIKAIGTSGTNLVPSLLHGRVDALLGVTNVEVPIIEKIAPGKGVNALLYADHGVPILGSLGIVANNSFLRQHPDEVRAFVRGTIEGLRAAAKDPQAAVSAAHKEFPRTDKALLLAELKASLPLGSTGPGSKIGAMSNTDWRATLDLIRQYIDPKIDTNPALYYSNAYLPS